MCHVETPCRMTGQVSDPPCVHLIVSINYILTAELDFGLHPSGGATAGSVDTDDTGA
jgi:hypothetical protein